MWRWIAGALAALLLAAVGVIVFSDRARSGAVLPAQPAPQLAAGAADQSATLPDTVPAASERTREEKRFDRYDKDRDGTVTRDEYLLQRRKAFAKLDTNHDGQLSFDEWAAKSITKFMAADKDRSGGMNRAEFAATAVKHKPKRAVDCRQIQAPPAAANERDEEG